MFDSSRDQTLSPIVGGHDSRLKWSRKLTIIPKRSHRQLPGFFFMFSKWSCLRSLFCWGILLVNPYLFEVFFFHRVELNKDLICVAIYIQEDSWDWYNIDLHLYHKKSTGPNVLTMTSWDGSVMGPGSQSPIVWVQRVNEIGLPKCQKMCFLSPCQFPL